MAHTVPLDAEHWEDVLEAARPLYGQGGVMAVPTESFYALAAGATDAPAINRVQAMKARSGDKPLLILIGEPSHLHNLTARIPKAAEVLMQRYWPGPVTLLLPAAENLPEPLTGGTGTIGVRLPACPLLTSLLQAVGPVTGTSANRSGALPAETAEDVEAVMGTELDLIVDGGRTAGGRPSTIVDTTGPVRLIREGPIPFEDIEHVLLQEGIIIERKHA